MGRITFFVGLFFIFFKINAQSEVNWIHSFGGVGLQGFDILLKDSDVFYYAGGFGKEQDFDFSKNSEHIFYDPVFTDLTVWGIAIAKYDINSNLLWAKGTRLNSNTVSYAHSVVNNQSIYMIGNLSTNFDADLNDNSVLNLNKTAGSISNAFIAKYDLNGNIIKGKVLRSSITSRLSKIIPDTQGNLYLIGAYRGTINFDINGTSVTQTAVSIGHNDNVFVIKMNSNFEVLYYRTFGSISDTQLTDAAVDATGNFYMGGFYRGSLDVDPGSGTHILQNNSEYDYKSFVVKLNPQGNFSWGHSFDPSVNAVAVDNQGNFYLGGSLSGTANFNMNGTASNHTSFTHPNGYFQNAFLAKYSPSGVLTWVDITNQPVTTLIRKIRIQGEAVYTLGDVYGPVMFNNQEQTDFPANIRSSFCLKYSKTGIAADLFGTKDPVGQSDFSDVAVNDYNFISYGLYRDSGAQIYNYDALFELPYESESVSNIFAQYLFRIVNTNLNNETFEDEQLLYVYPNPAIDYIIIATDEQFLGSEYEILNMRGQRLIKGSIKETEQKVMTDFSAGVYYIKIRKAQNVIYSQKIRIK